MNTTQFCEAHKIRADVEWTDRNPNMDADEWSRTARHFKVTLKLGKRRLTVPFSQGSAHEKEPTAADVLDCLLSDASGIENARSFEDWCAEYGYDPDSRKHERTFKLVESQTAKLRRFLGDEYEDALWKVERL